MLKRLGSSITQLEHWDERWECFKNVYVYILLAACCCLNARSNGLLLDREVFGAAPPRSDKANEHADTAANMWFLANAPPDEPPREDLGMLSPILKSKTSNPFTQRLGLRKTTLRQ